MTPLRFEYQNVIMYYKVYFTQGLIFIVFFFHFGSYQKYCYEMLNLSSTRPSVQGINLCTELKAELSVDYKMAQC